MFSVTGLGEILIDFTPAGLSPAGNVMFERNPGGGPANLLAAVARLGGKGAFIGKVGNDQFGEYLKNVLVENGIEASGLRFSKSVNTTLAFVHLDEKGERSFSFYRNPGADLMLDERDLDFKLIENSKILHFSSLSLSDEPARSATKSAIEYAKKHNKIISFDPNWRPPLWKSEAEAKKQMKYGVENTDILKISEVEMEFITGERDLDIGSKILYETGVKLVVVTLGSQGCYYRSKAGTGRLPAYKTKVVDTTGAGDAFLGGLLYNISKMDVRPDQLTKEQLEKIIDFSNAVGALCVTKRGGMPAMPSLQEVEACMKNTPKLI